MSVILEEESNDTEVLMLCKGAESHVAPKCVDKPIKAETLEHIDGYAEVRILWSRANLFINKPYPLLSFKANFIHSQNFIHRHASMSGLI